MFETFLNREINSKNKFSFFKETIDNFLIKNSKENIFVNYFCKIQKIYNTLNRFIYNYKFKKAHTVVNTNMGLNEINLSDKHVICIFHNNSKYLFSIYDLIKIINSALTNSYSYFSEPKCIKNPYDNIPFKKSTLYNIYFFIRYKTDYYPELFFKFFNVDFNLTAFKNKHEYILREYTIKDFIDNSPSNILIDEISNMIRYYNDFCNFSNLKKHKIHIDINFPNDKLIKIMKPYLSIFMTSQYSYLVHIKREASYILKQKLLIFNKYNPCFGRKKCKVVRKFTDGFGAVCTRIIVEFNDKHINFNNIDRQNQEFLSDHLNYNDAIYLDEREVVRSYFTFNFINNDDFEEITEDEEEDDDSIIENNTLDQQLEYVYEDDNSDTDSLS